MNGSTCSLSLPGTLLRPLVRFFFPPTCYVCHRELVEGERGLCLHCHERLAEEVILGAMTSLEKRLFGRASFEHAVCYYEYDKMAESSNMLAKSKYRNKPFINYHLALILATELKHSGWPLDIDVIVPIPLHWRRLLSRGYNQVDPIVEALVEVWHLPVEYNGLVKTRHTPSQVGRSYKERLRLVKGVFRVPHPERLRGRHVLLVDDVVTTGATIMSGVETLLSIGGDIRVSILTLGLVT